MKLYQVNKTYESEKEALEGIIRHYELLLEGKDSGIKYNPECELFHWCEKCPLRCDRVQNRYEEFVNKSDKELWEDEKWGEIMIDLAWDRLSLYEK